MKEIFVKSGEQTIVDQETGVYVTRENYLQLLKSEDEVTRKLAHDFKKIFVEGLDDE